jgi:DNA-binding NarL/FixJ family response regulator
MIPFAAMENIKALIVEDDETFRLTFKKLLLSRFPQMDVAEAEKGEEALEKMTSFSPDIVFMDIKLPGENGLQVTKKIRIHFPDTPIIILTSYDLPEYRQAARASGANHFASKHTTSAEEIFSLVETILES